MSYTQVEVLYPLIILKLFGNSYSLTSFSNRYFATKNLLQLFIDHHQHPPTSLKASLLNLFVSILRLKNDRGGFE
ncbi:hypothetical protein F8388_018083 [Cannabis sativa]|uniref:Uncharacterized protein n=1 Tax=Cannabis sativa TaxID=3483 RepID=A0A7J6HMC2_CANSA|nr:hypothetical protein F8388_018083 [Cannabis sativa]